MAVEQKKNRLERSRWIEEKWRLVQRASGRGDVWCLQRPARVCAVTREEERKSGGGAGDLV